MSNLGSTLGKFGISLERENSLGLLEEVAVPNSISSELIKVSEIAEKNPR